MKRTGRLASVAVSIAAIALAGCLDSARRGQGGVGDTDVGGDVTGGADVAGTDDGSPRTPSKAMRCTVSIDFDDDGSVDQTVVERYGADGLLRVRDFTDHASGTEASELLGYDAEGQLVRRVTEEGFAPRPAEFPFTASTAWYGEWWGHYEDGRLVEERSLRGDERRSRRTRQTYDGLGRKRAWLAVQTTNSSKGTTLIPEWFDWRYRPDDSALVKTGFSFGSYEEFYDEQGNVVVWDRSPDSKVLVTFEDGWPIEKEYYDYWNDPPLAQRQTWSRDDQGRPTRFTVDGIHNEGADGQVDAVTSYTYECEDTGEAPAALPVDVIFPEEPSGAPYGDLIEVEAGVAATPCAGVAADFGCAGADAVDVPAFRIDRSEVSTQAYAGCVGDGACTEARLDDELSMGCQVFEGTETHPVTCVTAAQAEAFCAWSGKRLCTAAEWARALGDDGPVATCEDGAQVRSERPGCGSGWTRPVGLGLDVVGPGVEDMRGNVAEWVKLPPELGPEGVVIAGEAFQEDLDWANSDPPRDLRVGFRCCAAAP